MTLRWDDSVADKVKEAGQQGVMAAMEVALSDHVIPLTPKVTGALRNSLQVVENDAGGDPSAKIGSDLIYAKYQHELEGTNYSEPGTGPKFLERGVHAAADVIPEAIAGPIRRVLE